MKNFLKMSFVLFCLFFYNKPASALGISPYIVEMSSEKGQESVQTIKIFNDSKISYTVKTYAHDIEFDKNGKKIHKAPGNSDDSTAKYVEIIPKNLTLKSNETKEVKIVMKAPQQWTGGKSALVFFDAKPELPEFKPTKNKSIQARLELNLSIGALILHQVKGSSTIKSRIVKADVLSKKSGKKLEVKLDVKNEGNAHIKTTGFASIFNSEESFIGKVEFPETIVFPGTQETILTNWEGEKLEPGLYHALITYEYGEDKSVVIDKVFNIN